MSPANGYGRTRISLALLCRIYGAGWKRRKRLGLPAIVRAAAREALIGRGTKTEIDPEVRLCPCHDLTEPTVVAK